MSVVNWHKSCPQKDQAMKLKTLTFHYFLKLGLFPCKVIWCWSRKTYLNVQKPISSITYSLHVEPKFLLTSTENFFDPNFLLGLWIQISILSIAPTQQSRPNSNLSLKSLATAICLSWVVAKPMWNCKVWLIASTILQRLSGTSLVFTPWRLQLTRG